MGIEITNDIELTIPGYPGVVVHASRPASLREFIMLRKFERLGSLAEDSLEEIDAALVEFGNTFLTSWNVDRRGEPVPANGEGLASLPAMFQFSVLKAWLNGIGGAGLSGPLADASPGGEPSPEQLATTGAS